MARSTSTRSTAASSDAAAAMDAAVASSTAITHRQEFLSYLFSLMRASGNDHGDNVPLIDASLHKHLAYVLAAMLYFFRAFETVWPSGVTHQLMALVRTVGRGIHWYTVSLRNYCLFLDFGRPL